MIRNVQQGDIRTSGRQFVKDAEAVAQGVRARLRMFLGESFVDISQGTPWFQSILGKTPPEIAELNIKQRVFTAPGVLQVRRFRFDPDMGRRRLNVEMTLVAASGEDVAVTLDEVI